MRSDRYVISGRREDITLLEGAQASPARPAGKGGMKMKTLRWWEVTTSDRQRNFLFSGT
jgi:hypothetical protein